MDLRLKRAKELAGYAVQLTKEEGLPAMLRRGAGFVKRRCLGKKARYLPDPKVLEAQKAEMAGKMADTCGLPAVSILTPLYNTPEKFLRMPRMRSTAMCGVSWRNIRQRINGSYIKKSKIRALQPIPMPQRSWQQGNIWLLPTTMISLRHMPCTPWARQSCSCGSGESRTALSTATKRCSVRISVGQ